MLVVVICNLRGEKQYRGDKVGRGALKPWWL